MDTLNLHHGTELVPGGIYELRDISVQSQVLYDEQSWMVVAHAQVLNKGISYPVTEIANGAYYANRLTLPSDTPVMLI